MMTLETIREDEAARNAVEEAKRAGAAYAEDLAAAWGDALEAQYDPDFYTN